MLTAVSSAFASSPPPVTAYDRAILRLTAEPVAPEMERRSPLLRLPTAIGVQCLALLDFRTYAACCRCARSMLRVAAQPTACPDATLRVRSGSREVEAALRALARLAPRRLRYHAAPTPAFATVLAKLAPRLVEFEFQAPLADWIDVATLTGLERLGMSALFVTSASSASHTATILTGALAPASLRRFEADRDVEYDAFAQLLATCPALVHVRLRRLQCVATTKRYVPRTTVAVAFPPWLPRSVPWRDFFALLRATRADWRGIGTWYDLTWRELLELGAAFPALTELSLSRLAPPEYPDHAPTPTLENGESDGDPGRSGGGGHDGYGYAYSNGYAADGRVETLGAAFPRLERLDIEVTVPAPCSAANRDHYERAFGTLATLTELRVDYTWAVSDRSGQRLELRLVPTSLVALKLVASRLVLPQLAGLTRLERLEILDGDRRPTVDTLARLAQLPRLSTLAVDFDRHMASSPLFAPETLRFATSLTDFALYSGRVPLALVGALAAVRRLRLPLEFYYGGLAAVEEDKAVGWPKPHGDNIRILHTLPHLRTLALDPPHSDAFTDSRESGPGAMCLRSFFEVLRLLPPAVDTVETDLCVLRDLAPLDVAPHTAFGKVEGQSRVDRETRDFLAARVRATMAAIGREHGLVFRDSGDRYCI